MILEGVEGTGRTKETPNSGQQSQVEQQQDQFMTILLEQLKNQNPLNPMSNDKFVGQMAQLTSLQETTKLRESFEDFTRTAQTSKFLSLLGKQVSARTGQGDQVTGEVSRVKFKGGNTVLVIGGREITAGGLQSIGLVSSGSESPDQ